MSETALTEPNLHLGLLAIRNEFVNLSELRHCVEVRRKIYGKSRQTLPLGEVLVQQRYLTPQDLEYLHMLAEAEPPSNEIDMRAIEAEFDRQVANLRPGENFGDYRIEEEIGRGGMGIVFRATTLTDEAADVALKILIGGKDATVRDIERFKKEATVMAPLIHRGIVGIIEVGRHKGLDFIAMEYVGGVSLKQLVGDKPLPAELALMIVESSSEAVGFMHKNGIIHRDIKPENIMVRPDGSSVLMDFGLAGWDKIEILAGRGSIGTPMYQPPEQADVGGPFGKISPASDVYGLGATLYYLLTARHPFLGRTVKEVREKIKTKPPDPIRAVNSKVHPAAEALCLRCLRKRQSERFKNPKELSENVAKVLSLLLVEDPRGSKARSRLTRRIAAAVRKQGDGKGKSKDDKGKKGGRSPSGRGKAGVTRAKSGGGKISRNSAVGPARRPKRTAATNDAPKPGDNKAVLIIAAVTVVVGLLLAVLMLGSG